MKPPPPARPREDVAAMLRAGATYRLIHARLGVGQATIAATRRALNIPLPPGRAGRRPGPEAAEVDAAIAAMLRAGATYNEIREQLHVSAQRVSGVRLQHKIPVPPRPLPPATPAPAPPEQTLAQYSRPATDGHTIWTGPIDGGGKPTIWTRSKALSGWRVAFRAHHGREPDGRVRVACDEPRCVNGAHLTDRTIREAHRRADTAFEQIFGSPS